MRVRIHRGAHEIGGNCIEVVSGDDRIVLDLGRPLNAAWDDDVALPDVDGLTGGDPHLLGVLLSHPHLDHHGLARQLTDDVPVYMGADAARILEAAAFFSPISVSPTVARTFRDREAFDLGPFTITPYLVDHSAYDAYSLLIEAGGRRLFYSGDFRGHG
jgi:ribonuclease J